MEEIIKQDLPKLIVILGPTASGKTDLSIALASKFNGEIICADSRQIYKKMTIGTDKVPGRWSGHPQTKEKVFIYKKIPHYLIDFVDPGEDFSLAQFKQATIGRINEIWQRGKLPLLVGGTGLYIHAVVDNLLIPSVPPNKRLRSSLEKKSNEELVTLLNKFDPLTAKTVDPNNKRRLIRALEVCIWTGRPFSEQQKKGDPLFDALQIGLQIPRPELHQRINNRVDRMMKAGLLKEARALVKQKYGWHLPSMSGTGYRQLGYFLRGEMPLEKAIEILKRDSRRYARRQTTWFRRDKRIKWVRDWVEAENLVKKFADGIKKPKKSASLILKSPASKARDEKCPTDA